MDIRRITSETDARFAAEIMATAEPWKTYGRTPDKTFTAVTNPLYESYAAIVDGQIAGVVIVAMNMAVLTGYIAALAVHANHRDRGVGSALLKYAEERIFRDSPNVFLCVTSFNTKAQRLYTRNGYQRIGTISDFAIAQADEYLMRKTLGPQESFKPQK